MNDGERCFRSSGILFRMCSRQSGAVVPVATEAFHRGALLLAESGGARTMEGSGQDRRSIGRLKDNRRLPAEVWWRRDAAHVVAHIVGLFNVLRRSLERSWANSSTRFLSASQADETFLGMQP